MPISRNLSEAEGEELRIQPGEVVSSLNSGFPGSEHPALPAVVPEGDIQLARDRM